MKKLVVLEADLSPIARSTIPIDKGMDGQDYYVLTFQIKVKFFSAHTQYSLWYNGVEKYVKHKIKVGRHELDANNPGLKLSLCGGVTSFTKAADVGDPNGEVICTLESVSHYGIIACAKRQMR
ncbi:hypothetical protein LTR47_000839 [Exophiala xenobiotica]|nr:hypothetical protein LTR41_001222 [Exophiala xenobiotica]KAK5231316.1 hypothetical protein LTR72_000497 [Exophiala xenobiotica]KAK5237747.1 hypothetical protein LTR47_000839 [Exophiala xenobiotica]KAK5248650.1 hypothetical protein LTS06_006340 [Exophiala xenobiotica]KAK5259746.1 hypothetical protein LTR40_005402 [Exophiala xenobiotica]